MKNTFYFFKNLRKNRQSKKIAQLYNNELKVLAWHDYVATSTSLTFKCTLVQM